MFLNEKKLEKISNPKEKKEIKFNLKVGSKLNLK